jgi:hypothetical protein
VAGRVHNRVRPLGAGLLNPLRSEDEAFRFLVRVVVVVVVVIAVVLIVRAAT